MTISNPSSLVAMVIDVKWIMVWEINYLYLITFLNTVPVVTALLVQRNYKGGDLKQAWIGCGTTR